MIAALTAWITQYYSYFLMAASSLVAALFEDFAKDMIKEIRTLRSAAHNRKRRDRGNNSKNSMKDTVIPLAAGFLLYFLLYFVFCFVTVYVYAGIRAEDVQDSVHIIYTNMMDRYFWSNLPSFVIVPAIVGMIKWLMNIRKTGFTCAIKGIAALAAGLLLIFSPYIVNPGRVADLPMEAEILTELRSMDFPYEDRIFDAAHLQTLFDDGYRTADVLIPPSDGGSSEDGGQNEVSKPTKDIDRMSFRELVDAAAYYSAENDKEQVTTYLDAAYLIYQEQGAEQINDWNAIGRMFYFMGWWDKKPAHYVDGAKAFLQNDEYKNALLCYSSLFEAPYDSNDPELPDKVDVVKDMMSLLGTLITEGQSDASVMGLIENAYVKTFAEGYHPLQAELEALCRNEIDSPLLQTLNLVNHVAGGNYEDGETLKALLQEEKYKNCPKLLILDAVYKFHAGQAYTAEPLYQLYKEYADYFEQEDRINLVWLLYESGEYIKTYEMSGELIGEQGMEESADDKNLKYAMLLIRAESYLQDSQSLSEVDENKLYLDVTEALKELGADSTEPIKKPITNPIAARLKLVQCILAGRIGIDTSYTGLSEICEELFHTDSRTGLYIIASLSHQDGNELKAITLCNQIEEMSDTKDHFQGRVLLLKADAWIALAEKDGTNQEQKTLYYNKAEDILLDVRDMAQNDYILSSQRLVKVYEATGKYDEAHAIEEELMKFR